MLGTGIDAHAHQHVMEILGEALEREPSQRDAWLAEVCAGDERLRHEVTRLLARQNPAAEFMEASPFDTAVGAPEDEPFVGFHIGPYKVVGEIGRGGMGAVYLGERDDRQFEKRVAIKRIKRGMPT